MEDPALAKGLVKRDIIRIVTPGSVTESSMLVESKNNYYACVYGAAGTYGLCFCDVSTGAFSATQVSGADAMQDAQNELGSFCRPRPFWAARRRRTARWRIFCATASTPA